MTNDQNKDYSLAVFVFDGKDTAKEALKKVRELKKEKTFTLEDVVATYKNEKGKVKLVQGRNLTGRKGAVGFGVAGLVVGTLLGGPLVGAAVGAAVGSAGSQIKKVFGNDDLKNLSTELDKDSSALFLLVSDAKEGAFDALAEEFGGKVYAFMIESDGITAMGKITEDDAFLAVLEEELVYVDLDDEGEDDDTVEGATETTEENKGV